MTLPVTSRKASFKRKRPQNPLLSRKKVKSHHTAEDLPWKKVSRPSETGLVGDDWILELEEVEGVDVVYEETERGKVARFTVCAPRNTIVFFGLWIVV